MRTYNAKFNNQDKPDFAKVLNSRVNSYFKDNNISRFGNLEMKIKTAFILSLYFIPLVFLLSGVVTDLYVFFTCWVAMGLGMSLIGLSIMHDANHGSYSNNKTVNMLLGGLLNLVGGWHTNWKIQHNVLHHTYTNIHEHDGDIENIFMRFSPDQEHKPMHKYQRFYALFLYSLLSIYWLVAKDYIQIGLFNKSGLLEKQGKSVFRSVLEVTLFKLIYISSIIAVGYVSFGIFSVWFTVLGFLIAQFMSGIILALIFQPAHVQPQIHFTKPSDEGLVENSWAIHQMRTTTNFATSKKLFSWLIGGLNFQVEHHLFPNICHVHYKKIAPIVKETAEEFNVPYHDQKTFTEALSNHFRLIRELGAEKNPVLA